LNVAELILSRGDDAAPAVIEGNATVTHRELRERVALISRALLARGHAKGDRIGILSENSAYFVAGYLGIIRAGLVAVPFQTDIAAETFRRIVTDAGIRDLLISERSQKRLGAMTEAANVVTLTESKLREQSGGAEAPAQIDPERDLAALMFTSGSTGAPKGVMVSHQNIETNTRDIISYMGLTAADRIMVVLPFHYCFGASLLHTHLMAGGSVVLNNTFKLYPETVLQDMQSQQCTGLAGVPSTYQILLRKSRFRDLKYPALRWFQQAGGKLPNPQIAEILSAFPQVQYFLMYGQTEATARLSYLPPDRQGDKLGSIGRGLPSTRLEVLKPDGAPVVPGSAETGEIVASGGNITLGYWNDPVETKKFFRNGKLHTGDIARVDADGFIFVVEREREMIKSGGNRVSAKEIEDVIAKIPEVVEVAVIGAPHELLGECIKAFIVPVPGAKITPQNVEEHCRKDLPLFKVPEEIVFLANMPHNSSGKIVKPALLTMIANRTAGTSIPAASVPASKG
jgi:acyl-CoA synthetase (AMP-forming)/AMP-acid ligase II